MIKNSSIFPSNNLLNVTANYFTYTFSLWKYNVCSPLSPLVLAVQRAHHLIKRFLFISFSRLSQLPKPPLVFCGIILCSTNSQALISQASKVMLKILQARLQQYLNYELPDVQAGFRKGIGTRDQIANIRWMIEKAREFQKTSISALLTMPKPLAVWITRSCGKFWKRWEYQTIWPAFWETCMQVRKQQLELDMEQQTGSK